VFAWGVLGVLAALLARPRPPARRVVDGFGKQYYPNGTRIVNDAGDEIRYPNGARVRTTSGERLFPNGAPVKSSLGDVRYPNGRPTRDAGGRCYYETGVEMTPCRRSVAIRQTLAGGATAAYALDIVEGTIDLTKIRFRFRSPGVSTVVKANLVAGRDRARQYRRGVRVRRRAATVTHAVQSEADAVDREEER
jgi:hypothetical protein